jgi:hypothetical protein
MAKLNKDKMNRDLALVKARAALAADVGALSVATYPLGLALFFTAQYVFSHSPEAFSVAALQAAAFTTILVWPVLVQHYSYTHDDDGLIDLVKGALIGKRDRPKLWAYLGSILVMGSVIVAAGALTAVLAGSFFGTSEWVRGSAWIFGAGGAALAIYLRTWFRMNSGRKAKGSQSPVIRGTLVNTFEEASNRSRSLLADVSRCRPPQEKRYLIRWAGIDLPGDIESHFGIVGINGSGKTVALQALMRSVIPTIRDNDVKATARRALVFDPENKFIPLLQELAGKENVHVLNPFDRRSRPWDLSKDIDDLATAQEMASIFISEQKSDSQPFWQRTARGILSAVLKALHLKAKGKWTLRHVFHIVTNEKRLSGVLRATDQTQGLIELLRPTKQTLFNVLAELRSHMDMLEIVAALWDNSAVVLGIKPFTLKEWLKEEGVLVFGRPTQLEDTVLALNRVLVKRMSQLIRAPLVREPGTSETNPIEVRGRTWIFLDELRNIGNLPGIEKLLTEGRSRGARVAITFQDIDGLREVYGDRVAEEIANQCDTMSYLRSRGTTAKWAAERLGRSEYWDKDFSSGSSSGPTGYSENTGTTVKKHISDAVLESELSGLPPVTKETIDGKPGAFVQGWHVIPAIARLFPARDKDAWYPFEKTDGVTFEERVPEDQILRPWDEERDWAELGFEPVMVAGPLTEADIEELRG